MIVVRVNIFRMFRVSSVGLPASRIVPLRAMPSTPVSINAGMSSFVIPPMAISGSEMPFFHAVQDPAIPFQAEGRGELFFRRGNGTGRNRCNPLPRVACNITSSNVLAVPPMMRSCPKSLRASSMGMSLFPRWTPSACKMSTHSTWSSKMKVALYRRHRASTSAPVRIHSSGDASFIRS